MTYIIPFSQLDKTNIPTAGGKGANLGEMTRAGFPIPPGFVLTTQAYDAFVQAHDLQQQIVELAQSVAASDPQSSQTVSDKIRALFMGGEAGDDLASEIKSAYEGLMQAGDTAVAVRSSATAEDLPTASFAGQQDTFLNIQGEAALLDAIKKCWASLWTARAISYRLRQDIDPSSVSLAVIVQQLIAANSSGVLFTANPMSGERNEIVINATWGLGEAIVGGLVTPDTIIVNKSTLDILARETMTKTLMTIRTAAGTEEQAVPADKQNVAVLGDETAVSLAKLGIQIEAHYNMPMDIEWAIADGSDGLHRLVILQARPITSLPPAPLQNVVWEPPMPNTIWMRRQIVEHMPEPLSPLFENLYLKKGMDQTMDKLLGAMAELGNAHFDIRTMMPHGFADTINGYAYTTGSFKMSASDLWSILKIYSRFHKFLALSAFDWDGTVLPDYRATIAHWDMLDLDTAEDKALLQGISEMAAADSGYWFGSAANLGLSRILDPTFDRLLKSFFFRHALPQPHLRSSAFLRGFDSKALDAQADMEAIANAIRESEGLRQLVATTTADKLQEALATHPDGQPVLDAIQHYLDEYGHQIYNLDFVAPTPSEDPIAMLLSLKALVENAPGQAVRSRQAQMAAERDALIEQIAQSLNPLSQRLFQWVWKWTKQYAPYREHVMFYMGAAWPTVRKLARELGQRLTDAGAIGEPEHIYYLDSGEITAVIEARTNKQVIPNYTQLAQERYDLREARKRLTPLAKVPERATMKFGPLDLSIFDPTPADAVNEGPVLNGYAVSTGRVTAPASVIHTIADFDQMQPNSILVCTTTTPAWTPLFSQAVGLVTDVGGALAHGSIVAREYGIPAVMGTGVATDRIKPGMMLAVDGDLGTVTLVDEVGDVTDLQPVAPPETRSTTRKKALLMMLIGVVIGLIWWKRRR